MDDTPIASVYKIANGFLLELGDRDMIDPYDIHYAKDATGIAELIIAAAAKEKLGIKPQKEMFTAQEMGKQPKPK